MSLSKLTMFNAPIIHTRFSDEWFPALCGICVALFVLAIVWQILHAAGIV